MSVVHITFGTRDLERGKRFYDAIMVEYGGNRTFDSEKSCGWAFPNGGPSLGITYPYDGKEATVGNGTMVSTMVQNEDQVRRVYEAALANGGSCEGPPGLREHGFYAAYFRDPDGNKMNCICMPSQ